MGEFCGLFASIAFHYYISPNNELPFKRNRMLHFVETAKALSDPSRVRALCALRDHELCVCQIIELLGLAPSTVSKHMALLRQAGLVESRKNGRWVYYRRPGSGASPQARSAMDWCDNSLAGTEALQADMAHLEVILKTPLEDLC